MAENILLEIVTPSGQKCKETVISLYVPGEIGPTGILPDHAAMVTVLVPGLLLYQTAAKEETLVTGAGFLEIRENQAKVLVDCAEYLQDIDVERAKQARERALQRLAEKHPDVDVLRAEAALARANARLKAKGY